MKRKILTTNLKSLIRTYLYGILLGEGQEVGGKLGQFFF
jgi:hypothetical protein